MKLHFSIFCLAFVVTSTPSFAQQKLDVNQVVNVQGQSLYYSINGEPFTSAKFSKVVDGSPYFKDEFMKGSVILTGGRQYNNLSLKLNLLDGTLIYLSDENVEMEATVGIKEVRITDVMTGKVFRFYHSRYICNDGTRKWCAVLDTGKVQLLRHEIRIVKENKPYASATTEETIHNQQEYLIFNGKECVKIKNPEELQKQLISYDPGFAGQFTLKASKKKWEEEMILIVKTFNSR